MGGDSGDVPESGIGPESAKDAPQSLPRRGDGKRRTGKIPRALRRSLEAKGLNSVGVAKISGSAGLRQLAGQNRLMPDGTWQKHTVPYGARKDFARNVQLLVAHSKDEMTEALYQPQNVKAYLRAIEMGAQKGDKTSIRMLHEIYDLAGMKEKLVMEFLARVGMASLEDVEEKVARIQNVSTMDAHQKAAACRDYLVKYFDKYPEAKSAILKVFGLEVPLTSESYAVVQGG